MIKNNFDDSKILNVIVNSKVLPNIYDDFSWNELNCLYRPIAIILNSFNQNNFYMFLMIVSLYHGYIIDKAFIETGINKENYVFKFFDEKLKSILGLQIRINKINDEKEMLNTIIDRLSKGEVILFPEDIYEVSYSPAYKETHDSHFIIIKGYNLNKRVLYVLDNIHNDAGKSILYDDFTVKFEDAYKLIESYKNNYDKESKEVYFWSIAEDKKSNSNVFASALKFTIDTVKEMLSKEVSIPEYILVNKLYLDIEIEIEELNYIFRTINIRNVFYKSLSKIIKENSSEDELINNINGIISKWEEIRIKLLYCIQKRDEYYIDKLKMKCEEAIIKEKIFLEKACFILKKIVLESRNKCVEKYKIINNKNAKYEIKDNRIIVKHNKEEVYDTWIISDDSWQLVFPINNQKSSNIVIETAVKASSQSMKPFHCGFILKEKNNKILFGNARNSEMAIYIPNDPKNAKFYEQKFFSDIYYLKITINNSNIIFEAKKKIESNYVKIEELEYKNNIEYIGVFSKTWEKIDNTVEFLFLKDGDGNSLI